MGFDTIARIFSVGASLLVPASRVLANGVSRAVDLFAGKPAPTNNTRWDAPVSVGAGLPANTYRRTGAVLLLVGAILAGCGGESTTSNPVTGGNLSSTNYAGPSPSTADIQLFKLNVWDNLMAQNRCGACHGSGGQSPTFVRSDDINLASWCPPPIRAWSPRSAADTIAG
jgi:hypothetical protein